MIRFFRFLPAAAALGLANSAAQSAPTPPSIVIFMADDLGWNHIGAKLGTMGTAKPIYQTPNFARMAEEGLSLTHAWLVQSHPIWKPKFPTRKASGKPAGPPPEFQQESVKYTPCSPCENLFPNPCSNNSC